MPASTREVFLLLRARDEASRVVRGFSSQLSRSNEAMRAAALRQQALALQQEVTQRRQQSAAIATVASERRAQAAEQSRLAAQARANGATNATVKSHMDRAAALRAEASAMDAQVKNLDKGTAAMVAQIREYDRMSSELERADRLHRSVGSAMMSTAAGLATVGAAFLGVSAVGAYFFVASFKSWQEYQRQVALTKTQVDGFAASMTQLSDIGLHVAKDIPVAFEQIQPALYDIFSSSNANLAQAESLLRGFAKAAVAGQTDIQTAGRGTIAILNGLNIPFENVNHILDVQFELVRKGVGTYDEFAKVFGRVIPAANRAQQSFETVAAMLAYMTRNGQTAAMASTAAARALELFTYPKAVANLEQFGVKVKDLKGNFLPLIDILKVLRANLDKLPQADRVKKIVEIFKGSGFNIQARRFLEQVVLGKNELEDFEALLLSMGKAAGTLDVAYGEMASTAASKTQLLANKWAVFKITLGEAVAPIMMKIIDLAGKVLDKFNNLTPAQQKAITNFLLIATAASAVIGVLLLVLAAVVAVAAAITMAGAEIFVLIGVVAGFVVSLGGLSAALINAWRQSDTFRASLKASWEDIKDFGRQLRTVGDRIAEAWDKHIQPTLTNISNLLEQTVIPAFEDFRREVWDRVAPKIEEAFRIIGDLAEHVFPLIQDVVQNQLVPAVRQLADWWAKNKDELKPFLDVLGELVKWFIIVVVLLGASGLVGGLEMVVFTFIVFVSTIMVVVEAIKLWIGYLYSLWDALKVVWKFLVGLWNGIAGFFSNSGDWLVGAGEKMIGGFIHGIMNKLGPLGTVLKVVAQMVANYFPHSPAKTGPLSGKGSPYKSGQAFSAMMAAGMLSGVGIVQDASSQVASASSPTTGTPGTYGALSPISLGGNAGAMGAGKNNYVTVIVNTHEIDPRTTATELGWELQGRL